MSEIQGPEQPNFEIGPGLSERLDQMNAEFPSKTKLL